MIRIRTRLNPLRRAARRGQVRATTWRQELRLALLALLLGAAAALYAAKAWWDRRPPATVQITAPLVEREASDYSVYRLGFEFQGAKGACHLVVYHKTPATFTVRC